MHWEPQQPAGHRTRLAALVIVAIPILVLVLGTLVLLWQLLGQPSGQ